MRMDEIFGKDVNKISEFHTASFSKKLYNF